VKRWLLTVAIVTIAAVAVVGAYWWSLDSSTPSEPGNGCPPCGTALAFGNPVESSSGGFHLYNFSVQSAGGGIVWGDLGFNLQTSSGTTIAFSVTGWNITVFGYHGESLAFYELGAGVPTWTVGASTTVTSDQSLLLTSPPASSLGGDSFIVLAQGGGIQGSISISIP
jgi:hypothetical protein